MNNRASILTALSIITRLLSIFAGKPTENLKRSGLFSPATCRAYCVSIRIVSLAECPFLIFPIGNKEAFNRHDYEKLEEVDEAKFRDLIDAWVLEYVEMFAAVK